MASILVISGTNRPGSNALRVSQALRDCYERDQVAADLLDLTDLPLELFAPQAYANKPAAFLPVQKRVVDAAGLHVVTPEYNGSFPGVLKYFIDMLKFPESFDRKPVAFVGLASGMWGGLRAVEQLQLVFGYRHAHVFPERVFVPGIATKFNADGSLSDAAIDERLRNQAREFARFAGLFRPSDAASATPS